MASYDCNKLFAATQAGHDKIMAEAVAQNLNLIGYSDISYKHRTYELPCGHIAHLQPALVRTGRWGCRTCFEERFKLDADRVGLELIGKGRNCDYRLYRFKICGHEQELKVCNVRFKKPVCRICHSSYLDDKSNLYLLSIRCAGEEFLKLGYAKDIKLRLKGYCLPPNATVETIYVNAIESGRHAVKLEKHIHKTLSDIRLKPCDVSHIMRGDGRTECYPSVELDKILLTIKTSTDALALS